MSRRVALVTGFEPYGGRGLNPSSEVVKRVDGLEIGGHQVVGRVLPVSFQALVPRVRELMAEVDPALVVSLGLWPGEPTIRLEQIAVNLADFEIPDNDGVVVRDGVVAEAAPVAVRASLPVRAIERALLTAGIPCRRSTTAGTFLCNATMYAFLQTPEAERGVRSGFVHVPYLPEQVADLLRDVGEGRSVEIHQRADLASMSLPTMVEAVRIVLAVSLGTGEETGGSRPGAPA